MAKQIKVGDYVGFKCDIEQTGEVVKITHDRYRGTIYHVRAFHGEYVNNETGSVIDLGADEIW